MLINWIELNEIIYFLTFYFLRRLLRFLKTINYLSCVLFSISIHLFLHPIAVSNRFPLEALEELFDGIALASKFYNVDVIGGDTTSSQKGLIISITAIGEANEEEIVYRNGANDGDVWVINTVISKLSLLILLSMSSL